MVCRYVLCTVPINQQLHTLHTNTADQVFAVARPGCDSVMIIAVVGILTNFKLISRVEKEPRLTGVLAVPTEMTQ